MSKEDLGDDPMDPRGDGTLQPGDPMYDILMRTMMTGDVVVGNRVGDSNEWDVDVIPGDRTVPKGNRRYHEPVRERLGHGFAVLCCRAFGHVPREKMSATICDRCRVVLEQR